MYFNFEANDFLSKNWIKSYSHLFFIKDIQLNPNIVKGGLFYV